MSKKMVDITLHINEETSRENREAIRDRILAQDGVMAVDYHDDKPHLLIVEYDPDTISSTKFLEIVEEFDMHAELIGL